MSRRHLCRSRPAVVVATLLLFGWMLASCGGEDDPVAAFCAEAESFEEFSDELGVAVFVPDETEAFFDRAIERLEVLTEMAPPTVARDVATVRDAYVELDRSLAAVGHDVTAAPDAALDTSASAAASDRIDEYLAAACREEGDPFTGFADDPLAPSVLDAAELDRLRVDGDPGASDDGADELRAVLTAQLVDALGVDEAVAACVIDEVGVSFVASFGAGAEVTEADSERFAEALTACAADR